MASAASLTRSNATPVWDSRENSSELQPVPGPGQRRPRVKLRGKLRVDQPEQLVFGEFDRRYAKGRRLIETVRIVCVDDRRAVKATLEEERNPTVMRQYQRHYRRVIHSPSGPGFHAAGRHPSHRIARGSGRCRERHAGVAASDGSGNGAHDGPG